MHKIVIINKDISNSLSVNKIEKYDLQFYEDCFSFLKSMIRAKSHPKVIFVDSNLKCFNPFEFIPFISKNWPAVDVFLLNRENKESKFDHEVNIIGRGEFANKAKEYIY